MKFRRQEPPFTVKVELSEGCNLRCSFCGLNGIRGSLKEDQRFFFMTEGTASNIAAMMASAQWSSRIEMALRGEPTLNPDRVAIVRAFRQYLPKTHIMMTSNGGGLVGKPGARENLLALFEAGLNVLALDDYKHANIIPKISREVISEDPDATDLRQDWVKDAGIEVYCYPEDAAGNPYRRHKASARIITFLKDITDTVEDQEGVRDNLSNHCGAAGPLNDRRIEQRCARPFRELSIRYDGRIMLCCNSWRGETKIGSVYDQSLEDLWQSDVFNAYRQKLYHGQRDIGECNGCDSKSFRVGLLPDPSGKAALPHPDGKTEAIIQNALKGKPMTKPVLRPWEKD